jgi:hypothetical protein
MYEGILLVALVTLVVLAIRPGKTNPVVIHKPGLYHATLAPQLVRVQNLIEQIVGRFSASGLGDVATQYFDVRDDAGQYLLAVGLRGGIVYFQAILPSASDEDGQALREFSGQVMVDVPLAVSPGRQGMAYLRAVVETAATALQITCLNLN